MSCGGRREEEGKGCYPNLPMFITPPGATDVLMVVRAWAKGKGGKGRDSPQTPRCHLDISPYCALFRCSRKEGGEGIPPRRIAGFFLLPMAGIAPDKSAQRKKKKKKKADKTLTAGRS